MLFTRERQLAVMAMQALLGLASITAAQTCSSDAIPHPQLAGAQILDLSAAPVQNLMTATLEDGDVLAANLTGLNFCEVNITYTHPGQNDELHVGIWLPLDGWNGRFQGTGGGGWFTGIPGNGVAWAVSEGYAAGYTDGGHSTDAALVSPDYWGLVSPGNVNLYALQDFASIGLHDLAVLGKAVTASFYGTPPKYSYWNGCSTGGRQGLMLAQRYPEDYDGIVALSPAINWDSVIVLAYYGQFLMNQLQTYPPQCEFEAITAAAIAACDPLDGLQDGIIASPELCTFDPRNLTGTPTRCPPPGPQTITSTATQIVHGVWTGALSSNGTLLGGPLKGAPIAKDATLASLSSLPTLLNTTCSIPSPSTNCTPTGNPFSILPDWQRIFLAKDPAFDPTQITQAQFDRFLHDSINQYRSIIGTTDADLGPFRAAGGKMITWHGMADQLLSLNSPISYYERVVAGDPQARDFYRLFEAPGTAHCARGVGPYPVDVQGAVVRWVEEGVVPERLGAEGTKAGGGGKFTRELCAWPLKQRYRGGDPEDGASFDCV